MNREQRRALKKEMSTEAQEKMTTQIAQFGTLPEACDACRKDFNKQNKEMVQSWSVVVKQDVVRLFCPECINKTKEVLDGSDQNIG